MLPAPFWSRLVPIPLNAPHGKSGVHNIAQPISVQQDGSWVGTKRRLNFSGATVTVDDDLGRLDIDIAAGSVKTPTIIHTLSSLHSVGWAFDSVGAMVLNQGWPTTNLALYVPFVVYEDATLLRLFWLNGDTVSGNVDCGVYDDDLAKVIAAGSTAQSGTSVLQIVNVADTALAAGRYWFGLSVSNTTGRIGRYGPNSVTANILRGFGLFQEASAFALPATATPATYAQSWYPYMGCEISRLT